MRTKQVLAFLLMILGQSAFATVGIEGTYEFQLYFGNTKPYTDEIKLEKNTDGSYSGSMHVPNDFDAKLEDIKLSSNSNEFQELSFFVNLPKKYHEAFGKKLFYKLKFLKKTAGIINYEDQFVGFVTHSKNKSAPTYVGSVVGFKK